MSSTVKTIIAIIVVVLLAGGVWYWWNMNSTTSGSAALPTGSDTSDAALDQDMTSITTNLQEANSDSAEVDQSVTAAAAGTDQ